MKIKARADIDAGLIASRVDAINHLLAHASWFEQMSTVLDEETVMRWMKWEQMYTASCIKYLREIGKICGSPNDGGVAR